MLKKRLFVALLILVVFASGIGIAFWTLCSPSPPSENDPDYIPYSQMLTNIKAMTGQPHPVGSQQLVNVRNYLLSQLNEMGVKCEVLSRTWPAPVRIDASGKTTKYAFADKNDNLTVNNILVKLDAPGTDRGVLFTAHYDSESDTVGACDDMTGVYAWLEAVRRQSNNKNLKNDLYFLFTDGEELLGKGAESFVRYNPEYKGLIDLVVNLDARGDSGGLFMFETSKFNYEQVKYFQAACSHPIGYSWLPLIYHKMDNGTDLTLFLNAGYRGLNFAVAEGVENIVSLKDDIDHLNRGTTYSFLQTAFDISDYAANNAINWSGDKQDSVYFTLLPGALVLFSDATARILAGFAVLAALACLIWLMRRRNIRMRQTLFVTGCQFGIIAASVLFTQGVVMLMNATGLFRREGAEFNIPVFVCITVIIGAGAYAAFTLMKRERTLSEILTGLLLLLIPLTALSAVFVNSTSYLFTFPTLGLVIVALLSQKKAARMVVSAVVGIGVLLLYAPLIWMLYLLLGFKVLPLAMVAAAIPIMLIALILHKEQPSPTISPVDLR